MKAKNLTEKIATAPPPQQAQTSKEIEAKKNEDLTLSDPEILERKVFTTYTPHSMSKLWA